MGKISELEVFSKWVRNIVISLNLCPFAKEPFEKNLIHFEVCHFSDPKEMRDSFVNLVVLMQDKKESEISNSFIIYPLASKIFEDFYDFYLKCVDLIEKIELKEEFQLVVFHPQFIFFGENPSNRINLVNRSPLPAIHILRVSEVATALKRVGKDHNINKQNEIILNELSIDELRKLFHWIHIEN